MEWLTQLLGIDTPEHTHLEDAGLGFRTSGVWVLVLLLLLPVLAAGVVFLYSLERGRIGLVRRGLLVLLRFSLLALLLFLLLRPVLVAEFKGERPRPVALLLDSSQSMTLPDRRLAPADRKRVAIAYGLLPADTEVKDDATMSDIPAETPDDPSRLDVVKAVLGDRQRDLLGKLQVRGPVRPYFFGGQLRRAFEDDTGPGDTEGGSPDRLLAAYQADEAKTALAGALAELLQRKDGELPAAVVLVTDGQDNASKLSLAEAARECGRLGVPLHVYGVGSSEGGLLQLRDVNVPDTLFFDDTIAVPVRWRARGLKKGTVVLKLSLGGNVIAERELPLRQGEDLREVLTMTPRRELGLGGRQELVASISLKGDNTYQDNLPPRMVKLSDSRVKVLYIENTPRWEYKFLQAALLRDRRVEARFILLQADPRVLQAEKDSPYLPAFPTREQLLTYDLVILGDVPAAYLGRERMEWLREFVRDFKGGLILIAGRRYAPAEYGTTPLAEVLPVEFEPVKGPTGTNTRPQSYAPVLTAAGARDDLMALADTPEESQKIWSQLPGFYWHYPVTKLRPVATALLVHPQDKTRARPMPVLATQSYGSGQVLFLATDETWRWRYNAEDKYYARFWGQAIYQLALPHLLGNSAKRAQFSLERSEAVLDRPGSIYVRLLDKDFRPVREKEIVAELRHTDDKGQLQKREVKLLSERSRPGRYHALLPHDVSGRFELRVPGADEPFTYRVIEPPKHEKEKAGMAEEALREAARLSNGRFYREEDLHELPEQLKEQKTPFTLRQEVLLWNPLVMVLFVGLISAEWVLRKFSNLS
jgi:hypothetical protein